MKPGTAERRTRLLLAGGVVAPLVAVGAFLWAASRHPGYDHVSDTISKLAAQGVRDRWPWTGGLLVVAVLLFGFARGLQRRLTILPWGRVAGMALQVHAILLGAVAVVRDDLRPGGFFTAEGAAHDVMSGVSFSALLAGMAAVTVAARRVPSWAWLSRLTLVVAVLVAAVAIAFLFTPPRVQGVPERVFAGTGMGWIEVVAIWAALRVVPTQDWPTGSK